MTHNQIAIASLLLASGDAVAVSQLGECPLLQAAAGMLLILTYAVAFAALAEEHNQQQR